VIWRKRGSLYQQPTANSIADDIAWEIGRIKSNFDVTITDSELDDLIDDVLDDDDSDTDPGDGDTDTGGDGGGSKDPASNGNNGDFRYEDDPLVLDLDGDGIELIGIDAAEVKFDLNGDGFATDTAWVGPDDGFVAIDRNGNGSIDDINELFGNTIQDGFAELATLDSNQDGQNSQAMSEFIDLHD
jgi:hypothetical protein